jgi:hypothetical protein
MFLIGPFRRRGHENPIVHANEALEPESVALAGRLANGSHPLTDGSELGDALVASWQELASHAELRRRRRAGSRQRRPQLRLDVSSTAGTTAAAASENGARAPGSAPLCSPTPNAGRRISAAAAEPKAPAARQIDARALRFALGADR